MALILLKMKKERKQKSKWIISEEDTKIFLDELDSLKNYNGLLVEKKFDLSEDNSPIIRKKKASYREIGEDIKSTLDLHGLTQHEAILKLDEFCKRSINYGIRTLMIIFGKGIHSKDKKSTLKDVVIKWLCSKQGRRLVEYYRPGLRREGGEGVFVFYLYHNHRV